MYFMRIFFRFFGIYKIYDFLNIKFSHFFFYNVNTYTFNLFNKLYKLFICNKNYNEDIARFIKNGYLKINKVNENRIKQIKKELEVLRYEKVTDGSIKFNLNHKVHNLIKEIFFLDFKELISNLEKYYNGKIILSGALITRNFNVNTKKETFSNYLHNDGYLFTCNQIFINLMDTKIENGPLIYINYDQQKKFIKSIPLFSTQRRFFPKNYFNNEKLNHNIGKSGDALLVNTSELLHGAGTPEEGFQRDILFLEISVLPKKNNYKNKIIDNYDETNNFNITKKIAKPQNVADLIKYFFYYYLSK